MTKKMIVCAAAALGLLACGGAAKADAQSPSSVESSSAPAPAPAAAKGGATSDPPAAGSKSAGPQLSELDTKRAVALIISELPEHKAKLKEICGSDIEIDIDWASFGRDKTALGRLRGNWGVQLLVDGFRPVCRDQMGKDAVKAKIKTIKAINIEDKSKVKATVAGGTFTAELTWGGSSPGMNTNDLGAAITKAL